MRFCLRQIDVFILKCAFASGNWAFSFQNAFLPQANRRFHFEMRFCFRQIGVFTLKFVFALGNWRFSFETFIFLRLLGVFVLNGAKAEGFLSLWIPKISGPAAIHYIYTFLHRGLRLSGVWKWGGRGASYFSCLATRKVGKRKSSPREGFL